MTGREHADIVGLDLSLTSTGIAVIGTGRPWCATIESSGKADAPWESRYRRLGDLVLRVRAAITPGAFVVLEAPAYSRTTGSQHDRSGLWWMVHDRLVGSGCTVLPVGPNLRAKYATGKGNAGKDAVLAAAVRRYADIAITGNDTADAVVLAAIGCRLLGRPIDDPMPKTHLAALDTIRIPTEA
ncbi:hypothetical protein [Nocardia sp. N2S4-5]|uniref:hypothetical protein n=1 Tax=Nocardia sp. N2S4-5 TaxID=3351565 RepID=UPI0037D75A3B